MWKVILKCFQNYAKSADWNIKYRKSRQLSITSNLDSDREEEMGWDWLHFGSFDSSGCFKPFSLNRVGHLLLKLHLHLLNIDFTSQFLTLLYILVTYTLLLYRAIFISSGKINLHFKSQSYIVYNFDCSTVATRIV